jgi:uncharacterized protein (DUF302 family)/uncharacterized membrane protein YidH (DUF202 family)
MADKSPGSASDYLAAERTFLAWIRTGVALMGFGFVVARFGLFLQTIRAARPEFGGQTYGASFWFGTALVILGVAVNSISACNHLRLVRELNQGVLPSDRPSWLAVTVAVLLALVGLAMSIYLISVREPAKEEAPVASNSENGIVSVAARHSVDQTVEKLKQLLQAKGVKLFALVDHSGEAEQAGMPMRPTKLLIFGNPKAGTPLMLASPSSAIDLPLKVLVSEDAEGKVWLSYNSPEYLGARHALPSDLMANIAVVEGLAAKAAE